MSLKFVLVNILLFILLIIHNSINAYGDVMGVYWDTDSGQDIQPGETIIVNTEILNTNKYKVSVSISIFLNYTLIPENGSVIELNPNGTWTAELDETNFILEANEFKYLPLKITAPPTAVDNEVYGLYMNFYIENYHIPRFNNSEVYVFAAIVNFTTNNNNYTDDEIQDDIDNPSILEPNNDNITKKNESISYFILEIGIIILITIIVTIIYFLYYRK